jgi:hypothetical protein
MTSKVVGEIVDKAAQSVITSKLYGESMAELITQVDLKPSERLVKELGKLYDNYCEKLGRDKLLKDLSLSSLVSSCVRRIAIFQALRASVLIRDVCSESEDFTVGILNKLKPSYRLLCGQFRKVQLSGIILLNIHDNNL